MAACAGHAAAAAGPGAAARLGWACW
jgi:hypothetical protein